MSQLNIFALLQLIKEVSTSQSSFLVVCPKLLSKFQTVNSFFSAFSKRTPFRGNTKQTINESETDWHAIFCLPKCQSNQNQPPLFLFPIKQPSLELEHTNKACAHRKGLVFMQGLPCWVHFSKGLFCLLKNGSVAGWCWWGYRLHVQDCDGWGLWGGKVSAFESVCEKRIPHEIETHNWGGVSD